MRQDIKEKIEQIKNGQVPQGYTQTKFGVFPNDWHIANLNKNADIYDGTHQTPNYTNSGIKFVSVENIKDLKSDKYISVDDYKKQYKIKPQINDILMTRIGDIGTANIINTDEDLAYYVTLSLIRSNSINSVFLKHAIFGDLFQKELYKKTLHVAFPRKINLGDIGKCKLLKPKEEKEQEKIASVLEEWDKAIELKTSLIDKLKTQKKALMQKLLTPKPDWQKVKLGDILHERNEYMQKGQSLTHVTLSKEGVVDKTERYERDFLVKDEEKKYKITKFNDICYNPANLKFGVICRNNYGSAIFSPIYVTYEVKNDNDPMFVEHFITRKDFINQVRKYEQGTVYERMAVHSNDFLNFKTSIPKPEQQQKIAEVLSMADEQIKLQQKELKQIEKQKKALMQLLLTGIVRVI